MDVSKLPGPEALLEPGESDGKTKLIAVPQQNQRDDATLSDLPALSSLWLRTGRGTGGMTVGNGTNEMINS